MRKWGGYTCGIRGDGVKEVVLKVRLPSSCFVLLWLLLSFLQFTVESLEAREVHLIASNADHPQTTERHDAANWFYSELVILAGHECLPNLPCPTVLCEAQVYAGRRRMHNRQD